MTPLDRHAVAEHLRALLGDDIDFAETALRLAVSELALRMSVDPDSPHPALEVIIAVVAAYGVDPNWMIAGEYDGSTHRATLDADRRGVAETIRALTKRYDTPVTPFVQPPG